MTDKAGFVIKREPGSEPGTYKFTLLRAADGRVVCIEHRSRSPIAPAYLRKHQARLNTEYVLGKWLP